MRQTEPLVLAVDCGTQSLRALILDKKGKILAQEAVVYQPPYFSTQPGYAEQNPDFYYDRLCQAVGALKENHAAAFGRVQALVLTTMRDSVLCLDRGKGPSPPVFSGWMSGWQSVSAQCPFPIGRFFGLGG